MNIVKRSVRSITAWSLLSVCALSVSPLQAQQSDANEVDDEVTVEEIIVTGSRIPRAGFDTLMPAIVVDSQFIEDRGFTDIASVLNEIPAFGVPGNSTEGGQNTFSVGQNFVNFFGLGSQRTLTLVNGRRFVSSNSPSLFVNANAGLQVDLNMIPASLIDRVETIAVGGAPIYGADAIAGTVNVIMKKDFEGFDIKTSYGISGESDLQETEIGVVWGANTSDGRGNVVISAEYTDREGLIENGRDHHAAGYQFRETPNCAFTQCLISGGHANLVGQGGAITPSPTMIPNTGAGGWTGAADPTTLDFWTFDTGGGLRPYDVGSPTANNVWSVGGEGIFLPDVTNLYTPLERTLVNAFGHYEIAEGVEVFGEFWVAKMRAKEMANQPAYQSFIFGPPSTALNFAIDHPMLTPSAQASIAALMWDDDDDPLTPDVAPTSFWLQRASTDLRPNNNANDADMNLLRAVVGLRGEFDAADRIFNWDISYNNGRSDSDTRALDVDSERFFYALDVVVDANGDLACRVVADPSSRPADPGDIFGSSLPGQNRFSDCVPLDIFGQDRPSEESIAYINKFSVAKTEITQQVISANLATDLYELPAGPLGAAIGVEHREETADFQSGGWAQGGLGRNTPINSVLGEYETDEIYFEFYAPLVSEDMGIPLLSSASIEGAWRTVDNSFAGKDDIWTIGGRFAPVPDIEFRGNVTRSVRAPAVTELFLPLSGTNSFANDPCDARHIDEGSNPTARRANCIADGIADPDTFISNVENASVRGVTGGNSALSNEIADAWTAGVILRPRFVEGLSLAIDYVNIEIEEAIESFTLTQLMDSCYDQSNFPNSFCSTFNRDPVTRQLTTVDAFQSGFINAGFREYEGITVDAVYSMDLMGGQFDVSANLYMPTTDETRVLESVDDSQGEPDQADISGQLNFRYSRNNWSGLLQSRFIGEVDFNNTHQAGRRDIMGEDAVWIFNGGVTYDVNETIGLQLNINNLFDETPSPGAVAAGWDHVYNNVGRFVRFGVRVQL
jgi:iron complex outermembrane receptor protein